MPHRSAEAFCLWAAKRISTSALALNRAAEIFGSEASALDDIAVTAEDSSHLRRAAQLQRDAIDAIKLI